VKWQESWSSSKKAKTRLVRMLYWLLDTSVRKNGSLSDANVLVLISFLLKRDNSNRGTSKEHFFLFFETTTKKLNSEVEFLSLRHVLNKHRMNDPGETRGV